VLGQKKAQAPRFDEELEDESEGRGAAVKQVAEATTVDADEDDALSYFQKLAES
jgi:hypothetical protein